MGSQEQRVHRRTAGGVNTHIKVSEYENPPRPTRSARQVAQATVATMRLQQGRPRCRGAAGRNAQSVVEFCKKPMKNQHVSRHAAAWNAHNRSLPRILLFACHTFELGQTRDFRSQIQHSPSFLIHVHHTYALARSCGIVIVGSTALNLLVRLFVLKLSLTGSDCQ